jgi:MFS transporter
MGGWMVWLLGITLYLVISNIWTLLSAQVLTAIGSAIADPIVEEEIAIHTDKGAEEFEWGFFNGSNDIVSGVAAILGGLVVTFYSFRVLIYLMITTAAISFMLISWYVAKVQKVSSATV